MEELGLGERPADQGQRQGFHPGPAALAELVVDDEQVAHQLGRRVVDQEARAQVGALLQQQGGRRVGGRAAPLLGGRGRAMAALVLETGSSGSARPSPSAAI